MANQIKRARKNIKLLEIADHIAFANLPRTILKSEYAKVLKDQEKQLHHYLLQYNNEDYLPKAITKEYEFPRYFNYTTNSKTKGVQYRRTRTDSSMFKRFLKNKVKVELMKLQGIPIETIKSVIAVEGNKPIKAPKKMPKKAKMFEDDLTYIDTGLPIHYMAEELEIPNKEPINLTGIQLINEPKPQGKTITIADLAKKPNVEDLREEIMQLKRLEMMLSGAVDNSHVSQQIKEKEAELKALEKEIKKATKPKKAKKI